VPPWPEAVGSSVTSNRRWFHPRSAEAMAAALPASPVHENSARYAPAWAAWGVHSRLTALPSTPPAAHSMWGHSADGAEWT
jgi:hypothetical protein